MIYNLAHDGIKLITFTISGTTYQAINGMTWGEWVNSTYNINGYVANTTENRVDEVKGGNYYVGSYNIYGAPVKLSDVIEANGKYWFDNSPYKDLVI